MKDLDNPLEQATQSLQELLREIKAQTTATTRAAIGSKPTPKLVESLGRQLHQQTDEAARRFPLPLLARMAPECTSGCDWCCYGGRIDVTAHEGAAIAAYIRDELDQETQAELRVRLVAHAEFVQTNGPDATWPARTPCPFLDQQHHACIVYSARPVGCRAWNSTSVRACQDSYSASGNDDPAVPANPALLATASTPREAHINAIKAARLDATTFEVSTVVNAILNTPTVLDTWCSGERFPPPAVPMTRYQSSAADIRRARNERKRGRRKPSGV